MSFSDHLRDFLDWWQRQLQQMLQRQDSSAPTALHLTSDGARWADQAPKSKRQRSESCAIVFGQGQYLKRRLSDRRLPYSRALEIAVLDLTQHTPFDLNDVVLVPFNRDGEDAGSFYCVIKKAAVELARQEIVRSGTAVERVFLREGNAEISLPDRAIDTFPFFDFSLSRARSLRQLVIVVPVLLAAVTVAHLHIKLGSARSDIDAQLVDLKSEATAARQVIDRHARTSANIETVRRLKSDGFALSAVWEELSRILPDGAWVTDFSTNGKVVSMTGFATEAAAIISPLDSSPVFSRPVFTGTTAKIPGYRGERFDLKMELEHP